jgi:hypothetical protein
VARNAFGVHIDLDLPPGAQDALKDRAPEIVAAFGDAALAVDPNLKASIGDADPAG